MQGRIAQLTAEVTDEMFVIQLVTVNETLLTVLDRHSMFKQKVESGQVIPSKIGADGVPQTNSQPVQAENNTTVNDFERSSKSCEKGEHWVLKWELIFF